jgi:MFS family permease
MADTLDYTAPRAIDRYRTLGLLAGLVLAVVGVVISLLTGGIVQVFRTYLVGFFFCTGIAVGSLAWLMLGHMSGGAWHVVIRRILEAATRTFPLLALMFIPIIVALFVHPHDGGHSLYEWSDPAVVERDPIIKHKSIYLNPIFFIVRGLVYFAVWFTLAYFLNRWSREQDATGDPRLKRRMQELSGPGILLFGLTVTFAAVDWGMSLEPHWFSTIYGLIIMAGWGLSAMAFTIVVEAVLARHEPMNHVYAPLHFHDHGKLLLAMVMLFAYFSFSQFLITWAGNLPEEIPFYLRRLQHGWQYVGLAVVLFHFALPFALLLSRSLKRTGRTLMRVALLMLFMRIVDLVFLIAPAAHAGGGREFHGSDVLLHFVPMLCMALGLGGVWLWYFIGQLRSRPLLPLGAPDLARAIAPVEGH